MLNNVLMNIDDTIRGVEVSWAIIVVEVPESRLFLPLSSRTFATLCSLVAAMSPTTSVDVLVRYLSYLSASKMAKVNLVKCDRLH